MNSVIQLRMAKYVADQDYHEQKFVTLIYCIHLKAFVYTIQLTISLYLKHLFLSFQMLQQVKERT